MMAGCSTPLGLLSSEAGRGVLLVAATDNLPGCSGPHAAVVAVLVASAIAASVAVLESEPR